MKLFAQMGFANGNKVSKGISEGSIDGAIFSIKDLDKPQINSTLAELYAINQNIETFIDPMFYTSLYGENTSLNIGKISSWDFFNHYKKNDLESEKNILTVLSSYYKEFKESDFQVSGLIAPNIYISESFDSREAVIAKNFIRLAKETAIKANESRPIFASLVISRETLINQSEFEEFLNDLTEIETPPDGFYLIVGSRTGKEDLYHTDVIANWMLLNYSLSINGYKVINGYSDLITPFLLVAGGYAGATGWWSNLRTFTINRFFPSSGGRLPLLRYLSLKLLSRITGSELSALSDVNIDLKNGLSHDKDYDPDPDRADEVLQSWEAISELLKQFSNSDEIKENLIILTQIIQSSINWYKIIIQKGIILSKKSQDNHLTPFHEAIEKFIKNAEL